MKKFTRLFTLLFAIVTILTVFTVVTLAADEEPTFTVKTMQSVTFDGLEDGRVISNDGGKYGKMTAVKQDNGNGYMLISYDTGSANYENVDYNATPYTTYTFSNYPLMAIDVDVMSPTGNFSYGYIAPRAYNGSSLGYLNTNLYFSALNLEPEAYVWHHVTYVFEQDSATKNVIIHVFVDGKKIDQMTDSTYTAKITAEGYDASNFGINYMKFSAHNSKTQNANSTAVDNFKMSFYTEGATVNDAAAYFYNDNYELPYTQTVATGTDANGETVYFDDLQEAVDAALENGTVTLTASATKPVIVDKAITINAGEYELIYSTSKGYAPEASDGVYTFKATDKTVTVNWDSFDAQSTVALGVIPAYYNEIPTTITASGLQTSFVGWSRENDGTADELSAITDADVEAGSITLYPVYETLQCAAEVLHKEGFNIGYVSAKDFVSRFSTLPTNTTVKLLDDVIVDDVIKLKEGASVTIDLNGYDLTRYGYTYTDYAATWNEETKSYVKGDAIESPAAVSGGAFFSFTIKNTKVTIKTSVPGSNMSSVSVKADRWICDGEVVKTANVTTSGGGIGSFSTSGGTGTALNIYGDGITFYVGYIGFVEWGGLKSTINVDGGTFVKLTNDYALINMLRPGTYNFKNAKFYAAGSYLIQTTNYNASNGEVVQLNFENCDIIDANIYLGRTSEATGDKAIFTNCRVDANYFAAGQAGSFGQIIFAKGTKATEITSQVSAIDDTVEIVKVSEPVTAKYVQKTGIVLDPITLLPTGAPTINDTDLIFNYAATSVANDFATVTWKDSDGYTIATTKAPKNDTALAPVVKIPAGDSYRAIVNPNWLDADGKISDLSIGNDDAYTFTATLDGMLDCDKEYVAYMTDARLSLVYYAHFAYNLYAPVVDGVTIKTIGGSAPAATNVLVGGVEYKWRTVGYAGTTSGIDNINANIVYTIDGITYTAKFTFNTILYAKLMVTDEAAIEEEKEAVACLVRYVEEACKYIAPDNTLSETTQKIFDDFYTNYRKPADYVTSYPANEIHTVNEAAIEGLIEKLEFKVLSSKVTFAVTLDEDVTPTDYKIFFSGVAYKYEYQTADKRTYYTDNRTLTGYLMNSTYTITVHDANGKTVYRDLDGDGEAETKAEIKYSMATYITLMEEKGVNVDLAKALYAFGKAVIAAKNAIEY